VEKGRNMKNKAIVTLMMILAMTMVPLLILPANGADPQMKVVPIINNAIVNQEYTVFINITDAVDLYAWEFQLDFNPAILTVTYNNIVAGGLNTPTNTFIAIANNTSGKIWWAVSTAYPTTTGVSYTEHKIFEIHFKALATGTSSLTLSGTFLVDSNTNTIAHTTVNGQISVGTLDLTVTNIEICNKYDNETWTYSIYANDNYTDQITPYYYPVNVTIQNTGTLTTLSFKVKLEVYYDLSLESSGEVTVASLAGSTTEELNFTEVFHPTKTGNAGRYSLKATVDSASTIVEDSEINNVLTKNDFIVTIMGDINGDKTVNIVDGAKMSKAFNGTPGSTQWNVATDLNHDNVTDILDATRIGLSWGESWA
jgi:hypothetical protein